MTPIPSLVGYYLAMKEPRIRGSAMGGAVGSPSIKEREGVRWADEGLGGAL